MTSTSLNREQMHFNFITWVVISLVLAIVMPNSLAVASLLKHRDSSLRFTNVTENSQLIKSIRERHLTCLAKNVYYEAGSEPYEGKVAVAQVTLNRANSGQFPNDICKVVYQKHSKLGTCEFSWYCSRPSTTSKPLRLDNYRESMEVAKKVLLDGLRLPAVNDALFFHGTHVRPGWKKKRVAKIGNHVFYK